MPDAMMSYDTPGSDERIFAEFYVRADIDQAQSKAQGAPVFRDVIYCKIIQPGDGRLSEYNQPVREIDKLRFPRQWARFQNNEKQRPEGIPISLLWPQEPSKAAHLSRFGVFTIEQLANLSDTGLQEIGLGGRHFQQDARNYLANVEKGKDYHTLADKVDRLDLDLKAKDDKIAALERALAAEQAKAEEPRRGPGRPSNAELAARQQRENV